MTVAMWISFLVLISACQFQHSEAQTTENVTETAENDLTLSCSLTGTFSLPEWVGPPNLLIYTSLGDVSEAINPAAPAASRLKFATNKRDLVLSKVQKSDAGVYKCSYTALGYHTITLIVEDARK
ncbi:uncharacterized protein LOC132723633 [Ruditapes philippinarum]|uniref:uncharacterized protein LOC132723633 n=1 Tax=Ruditapes philippinarum TaxID=129788 RepID=UPI00295BBCC4|nr:uncharacterized protein LOC132723633 [Ruditapes philippinarum]